MISLKALICPVICSRPPETGGQRDRFGHDPAVFLATNAPFRNWIHYALRSGNREITMDIMPAMERLKRFYNRIVLTKHTHELKYWKERYDLEGATFGNDLYAELMLSIADEPDDGFLTGKAIADFGCGPRGSLIWANQAELRIGLDVLIPQYLKCFASTLKSHPMLYITCTEDAIPLPDNYCDVVYSVNSLDHVRHLMTMCLEIRRILKPGGWLIGSFNLNHTPTTAEPHRLGEHTLRKLLFRDYMIQHWWISAPGLPDDLYRPLFNRRLIDPAGGEAYLWARAQKPTE